MPRVCKFDFLESFEFGDNFDERAINFSGVQKNVASNQNSLQSVFSRMPSFEFFVDRRIKSLCIKTISLYFQISN